MNLLSILLMVWVEPLLLLIISLYSLSKFMCLGNLTETALHLSILQYFLSSESLFLQRIHFVFFFFLLLHHFLLSQLLLSLEVNLIFLFLGKSFEVIWLDSMIGEHALLGGWVFSHEVMVQGKVDLDLLLVCPFVMLSHVFILLCLSKDSINSIGFHLVFGSLSIMLTLIRCQNLIKVNGLLIKQIIGLFLNLLETCLLSNLLLAPIFLL